MPKRAFELALSALLVICSMSLVACTEDAEQATGSEHRTLQPIEEEATTEEPLEEEPSDMSEAITKNSTIGEIETMEAFRGFGHLLFPVDRPVSESATLSDLANNGTYVWYSNLRADVFADALNELASEAEAGQRIFYPIYSDEEIAADPSKADTGLFYFRGIEGAPFAIVNAGGGFSYVAALHDSFPQAEEISARGYNAFALIYRPDDPYVDLARAITYVCDHAEDLGVARDGYSLWGGSAGARMAATLGNSQYLAQLTGRTDIPQASAIVMQYTGYSNVSPYDAPTYINVGTNDGIASWRGMQSRADALTSQYGIPTEFHVYEGLSHGFSTGKGTVAEGWVDDAINFWQEQS